MIRKPRRLPVNFICMAYAASTIFSAMDSSLFDKGLKFISFLCAFVAELLVSIVNNLHASFAQGGVLFIMAYRRVMGPAPLAFRER